MSNDELLLAKIKIARCMYANGLNYMSDAEYDDAVQTLAANGIALDPIYENDTVPYEAFLTVLHLSKDDVNKMLKISDSTDGTTLAEDIDLLNETESLGISAVTTFEDAFSWFQTHINQEVVISAKIDGINTRRLYRSVGGKLEYRAALTRGRKSDPINVTTNMTYASPTRITSDIATDLIVYSETTVPTSTIDIINDKYETDYTIPRGLAVALMRVDRYDADDYSYLQSYVFRVDYGISLSEGIDMAKQLGFKTVPYILYTYKGESFDLFKNAISEIMHKLKSITDSWDIVTDGMVAELNNRHDYSSLAISNGYSGGNIALKIGLWCPGVYTSTVRAFDFSQQADRCSCVAIVDPVTAKGGQKISRVNCYNPSVLFNNGIQIGSDIRFEYKNETTVNILLG